MVDNSDGHLMWYMWVYTFGPSLGAVIAGVFQIAHVSTIEKISSNASNKSVNLKKV